MEQAVIKTAGRVFEVLEYMREVRRAVSVREVSEQLGYPPSSTLVLLKSMATLGYLRYDHQQRAYAATARLAALGDWVIDAMFQGGRLLTLLEDIARVTGETAILAVENDIYAQYVHVVLSSQPIQFNVPPGTRRLLCMSGSGWALLSAHSDDEVQRIVQRTNLRLGRGKQVVDTGLVAERIDEARQLDFAFSRGTVTEGVGIIAVPLAAGDSGERLAVGVGGLVGRLERRREAIVDAIRTHVGRNGLGMACPATAPAP